MARCCVKFCTILMETLDSPKTLDKTLDSPKSRLRPPKPVQRYSVEGIAGNGEAIQQLQQDLVMQERLIGMDFAKRS